MWWRDMMRVSGGFYSQLQWQKLLCVLSHFSPVWLFASLWTCSPPGSSIHWILQARTLEWAQALFQGIVPTQGSNPGLLHCRQILYHLTHQGSPLSEISWSQKGRYSFEHLAFAILRKWTGPESHCMYGVWGEVGVLSLPPYKVSEQSLAERLSTWLWHYRLSQGQDNNHVSSRDQTWHKEGNQLNTLLLTKSRLC